MARSIAVAGKGGTGKTTITALMIAHLLETQTEPILAIDADPDSNLGLLLGIKNGKTLGHLRDEALKEIKELPAGMSRASYFESGFHQIVDEAKGFDLITMGKGEGPGCYCYLNSLVRKFSEDLMSSYSWIVMDNEAGLEHISRRTTSNIDALVVVVTDNPVSLNTAMRVQEITRNLKNGIGRKYVVTNMVREERRSQVRERLSGLDMEYLGDVPWDAQLEEAVFTGRSLRDLASSPAKEQIAQMMKKIGGVHANT